MTKARCSICNIKVGIDYFDCSCDPSKTFCNTHRFPFSHNCTKNCKLDHKNQLKKNNPVIKREPLI